MSERNKLRSEKIDNETEIHPEIPSNEEIKNVLNDINMLPKNTKEQKIIPFWSEDPNILFNQSYILEFFPVDTMTYEQKLNAVSRAVIVLIFFGLFVSYSISIILVGTITLASIFVLYFFHKKEQAKVESKQSYEEKEGFDNPAMVYLKENNLPMDPNIFMKPTSQNPFSNVLMTDYDFNPHKKPAPPSFTSDINKEILDETKQMVREINNTQPDITDKLFKDLGEQLEFEQSMRNFYSTPNTTIPNDQAAFAEFCYGSMISCKEGNLFACARNLDRHTN